MLYNGRFIRCSSLFPDNCCVLPTLFCQELLPDAVVTFVVLHFCFDATDVISVITNLVQTFICVCFLYKRVNFTVKKFGFIYFNKLLSTTFLQTVINLSNSSFPLGSSDIIFFYQVLHVVTNPRNVLKRLGSVLISHSRVLERPQ